MILDLSRLEKLYSSDAVLKLKNSRVLVVGVGGVGGICAEMLVRSGVGNITIIDYDTIDSSNINRQIICMSENIGKIKVEELEKRLKSINPECNVIAINERLTAENVGEICQTSDKYLPDEQFRKITNYKLQITNAEQNSPLKSKGVAPIGDGVYGKTNNQERITAEENSPLREGYPQGRVVGSPKICGTNFGGENNKCFDFVIDCIDSVKDKTALIVYCKQNNINIISALGAGNRREFPIFSVSDIYKTNNDGLAKALRKSLKTAGIEKHDVVYSNQTPIKTEKPIGSAMWHPTACACVLAAFAANKLMNNEK